MARQLFYDFMKSPTLGGVHATTNLTMMKPRKLTRYDGSSAKTPFAYDSTGLAVIRPDQMPRFLAALTDPDELDTKEMRFDELTTLQNRVDPEKVMEIARSGRFKRPPVVARVGRKNLIIDGNHRAAAEWLLGRDTIRVRFKDVSRYSNALKRAEWSVPVSVRKLDPERRQVFGWASVVEKNGELIIDKQGDIIPVDALEPAAYDFVLSSRAQTDMHERHGVGRLIESMVFTHEKQKALGVDLGMVGWWVGFQVDDDALWAAHKRGERPEFSIGGRSTSIEA